MNREAPAQRDEMVRLFRRLEAGVEARRDTLDRTALNPILQDVLPLTLEGRFAEANERLAEAIAIVGDAPPADVPRSIREVPTDRGAWPVRMFVPEKARATLIALHGAGGNEDFYFELYGAGKIVKLAAQYRIAVAAPRNPARFGPGLVSQRLADLARDLGGPVFLTGHSLGGAQALAAAADHPDAFKGVAAIAPARTKPTSIATYLACGTLDPLYPRVRTAASKMPHATWDERPGVEHLLIVGDTLPAVFDWIDHAVGNLAPRVA